MVKNQERRHATKHCKKCSTVLELHKSHYVCKNLGCIKYMVKAKMKAKPKT